MQLRNFCHWPLNQQLASKFVTGSHDDDDDDNDDDDGDTNNIKGHYILCVPTY